MLYSVSFAMRKVYFEPNFLRRCKPPMSSDASHGNFGLRMNRPDRDTQQRSRAQNNEAESDLVESNHLQSFQSLPAYEAQFFTFTASCRPTHARRLTNHQASDVGGSTASTHHKARRQKSRTSQQNSSFFFISPASKALRNCS